MGAGKAVAGRTLLGRRDYTIKFGNYVSFCMRREKKFLMPHTPYRIPYVQLTKGAIIDQDSWCWNVFNWLPKAIPKIVSVHKSAMNTKDRLAYI